MQNGGAVLVPLKRISLESTCLTDKEKNTLRLRGAAKSWSREVAERTQPSSLVRAGHK